MKIAIYGTGEVTETFCNILEKRQEDVEIVYFIQTTKSIDSYHGKKVISVKEMNYSDFDFLVIASNVYYHEMINCLKDLDNGYEQNKDKVKKYDEWLPVKWEVIKEVMPYQSCRVCGDIVYVALSEDETIPKYMFESGRNFSDVMIDAFFDLVKEYYPCINKQAGYFLDIGSNIGTTSIYVKKKINNKLRVIGFELCKSNYDLFRVNCILNQTEDITTELLGLSNENIRKKYNFSPYNSGSTKIVDEAGDGMADTVQAMKLDTYLKEKNISPEEIDYIWMDTEGHECEIIEGAAETLKTKKIPLLQEFNPIEYKKKNMLETYCKNMEEFYDSFLDMSSYMKGSKKIFSISQIYEFAMEMERQGKVQTDLFFFSGENQ